MGFFSNIFKKKKGGTFFGNLVRGVANTATGGILGTGKELATWQAKTEESEYNKALAENQRLIEQSKGFGMGSEMGAPLKGEVDNFMNDSDVAKQVQNQQVQAWVSRNWWVIALPVVGVTALVIYLIKRK